MSNNFHQMHRGGGRIQIIFGPMFSGKTSELIRRMKRFQVANYHCLVVKYENDTRYDQQCLATHDKQVLSAVSTSKLEKIRQLAENCDVIGVDEGQFFPDIVEFCEDMANRGKIIIISALDGTFQRKPFGEILELVPLAENVTKLTAVCMTCYGDASFTKRKGGEKEIEVIGGMEKYLAVCRTCYNLNIYESPRKNVNDNNKRPMSPEVNGQTNGKRILLN
ncbi:DgyrCDS6233 [Dimorphilus gyrociliatus]|uniref:Thymidine kinase n=1 Tax=Dimorphilus gyrociliatus TaxID=2664684 RepID=A0A7I8VMF3_9ANNE|nr:DgyrCDS6233 [Dimorphilus gyrociliatus]